jgi:hypothetical protein
MGVKFFKCSSSVYDNNKCKNKNISSNSNPNPDPSNYKILNYETDGNYSIVKIQYLNCKNYEGIKILLYKGDILENLIYQKTIDPHFSDNDKFISPIARFEPTEVGMSMARTFLYKV